MVKILLISVVSLFGTICAYKSGAPKTDEVCRTMTPDHGAQIQPGNTFPYNVTVDKTSIKPGESVVIKITGSNQHPIRGFFVQARVGNTPMGHFAEGPEVQAIDCLKGAMVKYKSLCRIKIFKILSNSGSVKFSTEYCGRK
ncbi:hypothetical protein PR048_015690 [Dryococelus australis]|uniref:Reelin domain-containing protein n=1 Tax=Dryococelus australis TaxID=614101 RepID=A0ABQ9HHT6_9NEOP|nr:hypothetical protein PR048_015690 [Dryococelus australis]